MKKIGFIGLGKLGLDCAEVFAEYYEVPWNNPKAKAQGFSPRGMDIDRNNVVWVALGSGHLASFDRSKCKGPLHGPTATGPSCPKCGATNRPGADICYICQEPFVATPAPAGK